MTHAAAPTPKLRADSTLIEASLSPLPLEAVRAALPRQSELPVPAKLILAEGGTGGLLAEVPRYRERDLCEACAFQAIEAALAWLEEDFDPAWPRDSEAHRSEAIEQALELLSWDWEAIDGDGTGYRIHAIGASINCRVEVRSSDGLLRVTTPPTGLKGHSPEAVEAAQLFALEANRRLRLARLTICDAAGQEFRAVWDAPLAAGVDPDPALAELAEAVVCARTETIGALRALCDSRVADTYLQLRRAGNVARRRTNTAKRKPAGKHAGSKQEGRHP